MAGSAGGVGLNTHRFDEYLVLMKFSILESFGIWDAGNDASQYLYIQISLSTPNTTEIKVRAEDGGKEAGGRGATVIGEWKGCQGKRGWGDTYLLDGCPIGASSESVRLSRHLNPQT